MVKPTPEVHINMAVTAPSSSPSPWEDWLSDLPEDNAGAGVMPEPSVRLWPLIANLPVRLHLSGKQAPYVLLRPAHGLALFGETVHVLSRSRRVRCPSHAPNTAKGHAPAETTTTSRSHGAQRL